MVGVLECRVCGIPLMGLDQSLCTDCQDERDPVAERLAAAEGYSWQDCGQCGRRTWVDADGWCMECKEKAWLDAEAEGWL